MIQEDSGFSYFNMVNQFVMYELKFCEETLGCSDSSISGILPEPKGDFEESCSVLLISLDLEG